MRYLSALTRLRGSHAVAGMWAARALRQVRRELPRSGLATYATPPPDGLPPRTVSVVRIVLKLGRASCLQRTIVLQRWLSAHGRHHDIMIGVPDALDGFIAHAWLERYDPPEEGADYTVLTRRHPLSLAPPSL